MRRRDLIVLFGGAPVVCLAVGVRAQPTVQLTEKQRRERARQMILEAFRERTPLTVEGECRVVAGKDNRDAVTVSGEQANGEASEEREG